MDRALALAVGPFAVTPVVTVLLLLHALAASAAPGRPPGGGAGAAAPRVQAQLYVWVQHFSAQGTTLDENLDEALEVTAAAGFRAVQGWLSFFETEAAAREVGARLARNRLAMPSAYAGGVLHDPARVDATIADVVARARRGKDAVGLALVVLNPDVRADGAEKTDDELATQARALDRLAAALKAHGIGLAVHAHDKEMRSDAREWRHILAHTGPDVGACLDLHWAHRGGQDPLALLTAAGPRLRDLHLRQSRGGTWAEALGPGDLDHGAVARALRRLRYQGTLTVELAYERGTPRTRSLAQNLAESRRYVKRTFGH